MAKHPADLIADFHARFGVPIGGSWRYQLRARLIAEESAEAVEAMEFAKMYEGDGSRADILKECADVAVVAFGALVEMVGVRGAIEVFERVHESNMSKLGKDGEPVYREDGKITKGPNYKAPDLLDIVRRV